MEVVLAIHDDYDGDDVEDVDVQLLEAWDVGRVEQDGLVVGILGVINYNS